MPMEVRTRKADVTVNVTGSIANGIFSGADTFSVGSQTQVLGNTNLATGDVAGRLIAPRRWTAARRTRAGIIVVLHAATASDERPNAAHWRCCAREGKFEQHRADRK